MKNHMLFLLFVLPTFAVAQKNAAVEVVSGLNFTNYSNKIIQSDGRLNYDFGVSLAMPMKNKNREWLVGLRFMAYGDKYENNDLHWGIQFDSTTGTYNQDLPSGENIKGLKNKSSYYYFELPVAFRQNLLSGRTRLFLQASAGPSYFLTGRDQNSTKLVDGASQTAISSDNAADFRTLNVFAGLGLGLEFPIGPKMSVQFLSHAQSQLLSILNDSQTDAKWYAFGLRGGIRYRLL